VTVVLHVLALNLPLEMRHTHLTRQQGETPDLPDLATWLGVGTLQTDQIELFPVADLAGLSLSAYVMAAFDVDEAALEEAVKRLDVLEGSVLLVPSSAVDAEPSPGAEATLIASLPMAEPDHSADLPPADVAPTRSAEPTPAPNGASFRIPPVGVGLILVFVMVLLIWWLR
jgi:hypothetical protein